MSLPGHGDEHLVEGPEGPVAQVGQPDVFRHGHADQDDSINHRDQAQNRFTDEGPVEVGVAKQEGQNCAWKQGFDLLVTIVKFRCET